MKHRQRGFTLIELMIVVAIIAILASISIPAYLRYVREARRVDAQNALSSLQLAQEKHKYNNANYTGTLSSLGLTSASPEGYYTIAIPSANATGFTATATAVSGTSQAEDSGCTTITMTVTAGSVASFSPSTCFKK